MAPRRKSVGASALSGHVCGDDPAVLADLAVFAESCSVVGGEGSVIKEASRHRISGLGISLDATTTEVGDEFEGARKRSSGDALAAMAFAGVATCDSPVRWVGEFLFVGAPVLDPRNLVGRTELAPADALVAVEDERRVRSPGHDAFVLAFTLRSCRRRFGVIIGVEAHAPAASEYAVVRLDERCERIPRRGV